MSVSPDRGFLLKQAEKEIHQNLYKLGSTHWECDMQKLGVRDMKQTVSKDCPRLLLLLVLLYHCCEAVGMFANVRTPEFEAHKPERTPNVAVETT